MKLDNTEISYISNSFKIKYARYMDCDVSSDKIKNTKTGNFPTKTHVIMKKVLLCHILMNFVSLSYGNELDISADTFNVPNEFFLGKDEMNKHFKFFLEYDDNSKLTNQDSVTIVFRTV